MLNVKQGYKDIAARVATANKAKPNPLRSAITDLFVNHPGVTPHDKCSSATAKMARYKLANGRSVGHEIDVAAQHLWFGATTPLPDCAKGRARLYPATERGEGRHSNVNQMPDLRDKPVARFTATTLDEAKELLNELLA